jgi:hypothetical protein
VESWFREFRSGLPVLDSVVGRVTSRSTTRVSAPGARGRMETVNMPVSVIQTEAHRLMNVRFTGSRPEIDSTVTLRTAATKLSVEGIAFDSLHLQGLADASIQMDDPQHVTRSDTAGRFLFDEVAAGAHRFELRHPMLEAMGILGVGATVNISAATGSFALATPSFSQLWRFACGVRPIPADSGFILGTLRDDRSHLPVSGGVVMLTWAEARNHREADGGGLRQWEGVMANDDGRFAVCGVPPHTRLVIAAFSDSTTTGSRDIAIRDDRTLTVELLLQRSLPADRGAPRIRDTVGGAGDPRSPIRQRLAELRRKDSQRRFESDPAARTISPRPMTADSSSIGSAPSWATVLARFDSVHVEGSDGKIREVTLPKFQRHGSELKLTDTAGRCRAAIVVDRRALSPRVLDVIRLTDIAAIEFYLGPDDVPPQFVPLSAECGMFAVWTKDVLF